MAKLKIPISFFGRNSIGKNVLNKNLLLKVLVPRGETSREVSLQEETEKPK